MTENADAQPPERISGEARDSAHRNTRSVTTAAENADALPWAGLSPPYATIVADPPWPYEGSGPGGKGKHIGLNEWRVSQPSAASRYSLMTMAVLRMLDVGTIASLNAHLYLWTTNRFMVEAHDLARAWGFQPKTILTWVKTHQDDPSRVSMKTGYYFRGATEHVVFAVRGSLPLAVNDGVPTAFLWPRIGSHSVKPPQFGDLVERVSPGPYVELFARAARLGWDSWGYGYERAS